MTNHRLWLVLYYPLIILLATLYEKILMLFFQACDDGFQDLELQLSDHEQDGRSYENTHSKNSHPEARFAQEDDEQEIVSATDGTVHLLTILQLLHILLLSPILLILATYENCINITVCYYCGKND